MVRANVVAQLNNIRTHPSVALRIAQKRLSLHGWVYDIENGSLDALDESTGSFIPLADHPSARL
jgi:carbonic anhydrase